MKTLPRRQNQKPRVLLQISFPWCIQSVVTVPSDRRPWGSNPVLLSSSAPAAAPHLVVLPDAGPSLPPPPFTQAPHGLQKPTFKTQVRSGHLPLTGNSSLFARTGEDVAPPNKHARLPTGYSLLRDCCVYCFWMTLHIFSPGLGLLEGPSHLNSTCLTLKGCSVCLN